MDDVVSTSDEKKAPPYMEIYNGGERLDFKSYNGASLADHKLVGSSFRVQFSLSKIQLKGAMEMHNEH